MAAGGHLALTARGKQEVAAGHVTLVAFTSSMLPSRIRVSTAAQRLAVFHG